MTSVINTYCHNGSSRAQWSLEHPSQLSQQPLLPRERELLRGKFSSQISGVRDEGRAKECEEKLMEPHCCFYFLVLVQGVGTLVF